MSDGANVLRSEAPRPHVFALFKRDHEGREKFVQFCTRDDLKQWAGWPTVRAVPVQPDQMVLL